VLKTALDLVAIPRARGLSPKNIECYRFTTKGEAALSMWMQDHLSIAIEPLGTQAREVEAALIIEMEPPLCLSGWRNPQRVIIQGLRKDCQAEALRNRSSGEELASAL
jgi:hypothetical protein